MKLKNIRKYWVLTITFFITFTINAQQIWVINSDNSFTLNTQSLNKKLKEIQNKNTNVSILFPNFDGKLEFFSVYDNAILPKSLALKYPQVHSYKGVSEKDNTLQIRFTCTPTGIEGTLISRDGIVKNLTSPKANNKYVLQGKEHLRRYRKPFECNTKSFAKFQSSKNLSTGRSNKAISGGTQLKIIRLAVTTSGEYSDFFIDKNNLQSGSEAQKKAAVLAGVSTSINAINVAFERDLGVKFELIPNTDELFFLNRSTDPFNDPINTNLVIDQGAAIIEERVPSEDYDLGHTLVGAGVGVGLATVGVPCTNSKANGVTGFRIPEGFFFDFTLLAHELGHQLGGRHTQSADCQIESAIEVGSGTTIMGYSGACRGNNIQSGSDPFFHSLSIEQILPILEGLAFKSECGIQIETINNNVPEIPKIPNYTVPLGAPLYLEAIATDADNDPLTYSWEPFDLNFGFDLFPSPPVADSKVGPQFRVFNPETSPRRNFPRNGQNSKWEVLPTVPRSMNFKLFVRDGKPGGIAISDIIQLNIIDQATEFGITNPNTNISYGQNETILVNWNVDGTDQSPFNVSKVKIDFSYDGGETYPVVLANNVDNNGSIAVKTPVGNITSEGKIRISALESAFYTFSNEFIELTNIVHSDFPTLKVDGNPDFNRNLLIFTVGSSFNVPEDVVFFPVFSNAETNEPVNVLDEILFSDDGGINFMPYKGGNITLKEGTSKVLIAIPIRENEDQANSLKRLRLIVNIIEGGLFGNQTIASGKGLLVKLLLPINENVKMYPNPSNGEVTFYSEAFPEEGYDMQVYSLSGKLLESYSIIEKEATFNFNSLSQGLYLVKLISATETATRRLIIK